MRRGVETHALAGACLALCVALTAGSGRAEDAAPLLDRQAEIDRAAVASQERIARISDETQDMAGRYTQALAETRSLWRYNAQLTDQIGSQGERIADIERQLREIAVTQRDVFPLMERMVDALDAFVGLDLPFLMGERTRRVAGLRDMLPRADVSTAEKFRRILEAYQIELEYGRTLEAYEETIGSGDGERTVTVARLGRIALLYQTLDGSESGYWDAEHAAWTVDESYRSDLRAALRVARKQGAPDLLWLPVPAPKRALRTAQVGPQS